MNDKIRVNLNIAADISIPAWISPSDEELVRKAAQKVKEDFSAYNAKYQRQNSKEKVLALLAYEYALKSVVLEQRYDTEPYSRKIKELTELLEEYFKEP